ncbi:MAG: arginine--tRNA ligase [Candidatus Saccharibacteria bacterium]|nr:arginine--tRNA ligase [Candidatus Saccharibacteria bacterium]
MNDIKKTLRNLIRELYNVDLTPDFTPVPENIVADYSTNLPLKLAKILSRPPLEIAKELKSSLALENLDEKSASNPPLSSSKETPTSMDTPSSAPSESLSKDDALSSLVSLLPSFSVSISAPGFLNFTLKDEYFSDKIVDFSENFLKNISSDEYSGKTIICEFSDPNPFKVLHVGHLYTSVVGDSISRLFEYAGAKVIRANFGGDVGLHVAKTLYVLQNRETKDLKIEDIADCYVKGTALYDEDETARAEITKLNKLIYKINSEDLHDTKLAKLYWRGRELSYAYFDNFYAKIGVKFDKYYPESTVAKLGLKKVEDELEKGVYEKSDGAVVFKGEKFGLHTRVFINKEGVPTYEAKDVGLIFTKWDDYHFDKSVVITGNEQSDYMKVVLKSVEQYAPDLVEKTSHLTHGLVKLPGNVKMSSRKGNFLKAVDVLDLVEAELESIYNSTDTKIALAATKYAFLKYKMGGNIIFDPKESVKMTGNSGPYLLYSAVRARKILEKVAKKANLKIEATKENTGDKILKNALKLDLNSKELGLISEKTDALPSREALDPSERMLIKKILEYKEILGVAVSEMAPHRLATYLYDLAQAFSRFYEACPVAGAKAENARSRIVLAYYNVISHGLSLLGIEIPEEM